MLQYKRMKVNDLFSTIKRNTISDDAIIVFAHNVRLLSKHTDDIGNDDRMINIGIIGLTKTQINPSGSTCEINETLKFFNIMFNKTKFLSLKYRYTNDVAVLDKFYAKVYLSVVSRNIVLQTDHSIKC